MRPEEDGGVAPAAVLVAGTIDIPPNDPRLKPLMRMLCRKTPCRQGQSVHLKIPNGPDFVDDSALHTPYGNPQTGAAFIMAGETLSFEADEGANGPTDLHYVDRVVHPERTITFKLEQRADIAGGYGMRLTVSNPFDKALKFAAREIQPGEASDDSLGLCPAFPHGESRKNWSYPLTETAVSGLTFVPTEKAEECAP